MKAPSKSIAVGLAAIVGLTLSSCSDDSPATKRATNAALTSASDVVGYEPDDPACKRNKAAGPITYISSFGYAASGSIMDVFMARDLGYYDALCLTVKMNTAGSSGQQLVNANKAQFTSVGSAPSVLAAAANAKHITAIATYGTTDPHCILANKKIKTLKDLEGERLGYFVEVAPVARAQLVHAGVDLDKVKFTKITNYDPSIVTRGQIAAVISYTSNQCATLKAKGVEFSEFLPAAAGIESTYSVMEVNSEFLREHREVAADFMRATLKALKYCVDGEVECATHVSKLAKENDQGDSFPLEQQLRTWKTEAQWVRDSAVTPTGSQTLAQWEAAAEITREYGDVHAVPDVASVADFDLVKDLYTGDGELVWPGK